MPLFLPQELFLLWFWFVQCHHVTAPYLRFKNIVTVSLTFVHHHAEFYTVDLNGWQFINEVFIHAKVSFSRSSLIQWEAKSIFQCPHITMDSSGDYLNSFKVHFDAFFVENIASPFTRYFFRYFFSQTSIGCVVVEKEGTICYLLFALSVSLFSRFFISTLLWRMRNDGTIGPSSSDGRPAGNRVLPQTKSIGAKTINKRGKKSKI